MTDNEHLGDPLIDTRPGIPQRELQDDLRDTMRAVREDIEQAREHYARTGEWPPDPLLDEIAEIRREIMAEHGNDWRKVLQWHREQDELFVRNNPNARYVEKPGTSAGVSGR